MGRTRGGGGQRRCIRFESIAFRCMGLLSRSSPHPRDFLSGYLGHWDGIRRSGGPTYRYPSTRRSWSRALLRSIESFWSFFFFFFCCLWARHTKEALCYTSKRSLLPDPLRETWDPGTIFTRCVMGGDDDGIVLLVSTVTVMIYPVETAHSFDSVP